MSQTATIEPIVSTLVEQDPSFSDIVEQFIAGLDGRIQAMRQAVEDNELDMLKALAHQLKGAGGAYGYPILTEAAASLEQHAKEQQIETCRKSLEELASIIARVVVGP